MYYKDENTTKEEAEQMADYNENTGRKDYQEEGKHSEKWCKIGLRNGNTKLVCADCQRGVTYDIKPEFNPASMKDRRISYLSILSSLTQMWTGENTTKEKYDDMITMLSKKAYELNRELYKNYPTEDI